MHTDIAGAVMLNLLHGFSLKAGWKPISLMWSAQRLVALLALMEQPLSRTYAAGILWPETTDSRAYANLRSSLWRVQRACGNLIVASPQRLCLASRVVVDQQAGMRSAYRMLDTADPCDDALNVQTLTVLSADLLPDWYDDDWVVVHRERYHQLRLHALEAMCERLTAARRYGEAVEAGMAAIRAEPLRESAHQALIKVHLAEGNRFEAARQFESCCHLLRKELGLDPSPGMRMLLADGLPPRPRVMSR